MSGTTYLLQLDAMFLTCFSEVTSV